MLKKSPGPGEKGGKIMERGKTFVMSYSCGKDSTLALHKMLAAGHTPLALLVMFNPEAGRSYFHGADHALLARYAEALQIPLLPVDTAGETYHLSMEAALRRAKEQGAELVCFGDIDMENNRAWGEERCRNVGLEAVYPLWHHDRQENVRELLELGYRCLIKTLDRRVLPRHLLGRVMDRAMVEEMTACGVDVCGENGEFHTIAVDGPVFHRPIPYCVRQLLDLGAQVRFGHRVTGLRVRDGALEGLEVSSPEGGYVLPARQAVLALGHSARDTFEMLHAAGVRMEQKPFAVGVRIEHRQADMDAAQYRKFAGHPCLPAAGYKLSCHPENGRSAFSFCVCPGGQVVAAASEQGRVVTNGMSEYARDRENINGGLLVNVTPADFGSSHPLSGIAFQRRLEEAAFRLGGGGYAAPCQRVEDFLAGRPSTGPGRVIPSYRPGVRWTDLRQCLPEFVWQTMALALPMLDGKVRGYAQGDAVLTAVETRSSSPVRIIRDNSGQCNVRGLYPCGEGAGYAGGILSAAADGMRCAEKIWEVYGK